LRLVNGQQMIDSLDLGHDRTLNHQVEAAGTFEL
jgi:hypothetical protein